MIVDKERYMKMNSDKKQNDSMVTKGNYLMYYNRRDDRIGFEKFNFNEETKEVLFLSDSVSTQGDNLWDIEDNFNKIDFLIKKYGWF